MSSVAYLITAKTEYKLLEKKYIKTKETLAKWENRIYLAKQAGKPSLQVNAESQVEIIRDNIKHLITQLIELEIEVKKTLESITKSPEQLSIDPDKLLKDLESLIGDSTTMDLEKDIKTLNAENELERLKKRMDM